MKKTIAALLAFAVLVSVSSTAIASEQASSAPPAEAMILDIIIIRPLGIASLAAGTVFFLAALPFTLPSRSVGAAAERLVADPFTFTFTRPIGETNDFNFYDLEGDGKNGY